MDSREDAFGVDVFGNASQATIHQTLYGCTVGIHRPDADGRMWTCLNPSCPIGPVGWITNEQGAST